MAAKDHSGQRRTSLICFSKCTRCRNTSELRISLAVLLAPWSAVRSSRCFRFAPPFFGGMLLPRCSSPRDSSSPQLRWAALARRAWPPPLGPARPAARGAAAGRRPAGRGRAHALVAVDQALIAPQPAEFGAIRCSACSVLLRRNRHPIGR